MGIVWRSCLFGEEQEKNERIMSGKEKDILKRHKEKHG
jgi:hypothetical protein